MKMSRVESALRVVMEFSEAFNRSDMDAMMRLMSDDCVLESSGPAPDGAVYSGKAAVSGYWEECMRGMPGAALAIEQIYGTGLRCVILCKLEWTDAAGRRRHIRASGVFRVENGLIREQMSYLKGSCREEKRRVYGVNRHEETGDEKAYAWHPGGLPYGCHFISMRAAGNGRSQQ